MNTLKRRVWLITTIFGLLAIAAAACSSSEEPTETPATAVPPTETSPTATASSSGTNQLAVATATIIASGEAPDPDSPEGTLVFAWNAVAQAAGVNQYGVAEIIVGWGVSEQLFRQSATNPEEGWLAESFEIEPDGSKMTIKLRQGIQFHDGYGELTAEDLVWNLNNANGTTNPQSIHGQAGDYAALYGEARAIDTYTFEIPLVLFDVRNASYFFNQAGDGFGVFSKKAFEDEGEDWARDNIIATGPFQAVEWTRDDKVILRKIDNHWDKTADVDEIRILHVPEGQARLAMLLTGQADVAPLETKDLIEVSKTGFVVAGTGRARHVPLVMAGNYWETEHLTTGEPLDLAGVFQHDQPWVGNPSDPEDMEQARLVRHAIARAIDRETIAREFFNDIATPLSMGSFFPSSPYWQDKWDIEFDPKEAERLLDEAGYPAGDDGVRFSMPIFGATGNELFTEMSEAAAGELRKIGIDTEVLHYAYSVFRPTMVQRVNSIPVTMTCRQNNGGAPWDWPRMEEYTSLTRGGFGCGMEIPKIGEIFKQVASETDKAKRIELNTELAEYLFYEMLEPGIVSVPEAIAYNPKSISSWEMRPGIFQVVNSPENIVITR